MKRVIDWDDVVRRHHALGLWHATRFLATISTVRDPASLAADAVQDAWAKLWRTGKFTKGLFVTAVINRAYTLAARTKPISVMRRPDAKEKGRGVYNAAMFPVQVFGSTIDEITMVESISTPDCGDE